MRGLICLLLSLASSAVLAETAGSPLVPQGETFQFEDLIANVERQGPVLAVAWSGDGKKLPRLGIVSSPSQLETLGGESTPFTVEATCSGNGAGSTW